MGQSLKTNFIYSNILTFSSFIFPLVSFPYVSRIIGPNGVGIYNYAFSITSYFILFASLGLPVYGVREIAKARTSKITLANTFSELVLINTFSTTLLAVLSVFIFQEISIMEREFFLAALSIAFIISNIGNIDWFFRGVENYEFITTRTILVRIVTVVLLFFVVQEKEDYDMYYFLTVMSNICISILNIYYALKITHFSYKGINLKKHAKPVFTLFSTQLAISIYVNLDTVMLGSLSTTEEVGYYTASIKIVKICLTVITSLGVVLIPRLSHYLKEENNIKIQELTSKSLSFILIIGVPMSLGLSLVSEPIIYLFAGSEFSNSIDLIHILTPIILIIGLSNFFGMQILVPFGKEKLLLLSVVLGAVTNFILNLVLIPNFQSQGAAIATLAAEVAVTIFTGRYALKLLKFKISIKQILVYIFLSLTFIPIHFISSKAFESSHVLNLATTIILCSLVYLMGLYLAKDSFLLDNIYLKKKSK